MQVFQEHLTSSHQTIYILRYKQIKFVLMNKDLKIRSDHDSKKSLADVAKGCNSLSEVVDAEWKRIETTINKDFEPGWDLGKANYYARNLSKPQITLEAFVGKQKLSGSRMNKKQFNNVVTKTRDYLRLKAYYLVATKLKDHQNAADYSRQYQETYRELATEIASLTTLLNN